MIPGAFDYFRPKSVAEATKFLHKFKNASVLAGGHSLLPMMKLRMASFACACTPPRLRRLRSQVSSA